MATARTGLRAATGLLAPAGCRGFATAAATTKLRVLVTGTATDASVLGSTPRLTPRKPIHAPAMPQAPWASSGRA